MTQANEKSHYRELVDTLQALSEDLVESSMRRTPEEALLRAEKMEGEIREAINKPGLPAHQVEKLKGFLEVVLRGKGVLSAKVQAKESNR